MLLVLAAGACRDGLIFLELPSPDSASIIVLSEAEGRVRADARNIGSEMDSALRFQSEAKEIKLWALIYDRPLELLDPPFAPGPVEEAAPEEFSEPLPAPTRLFETSIRESEAGTWTEAVLPSAYELIDFRVPKAPCLRFVTRILPIVSPDGIRIRVSIDAERALLSDEKGRLFVVSATGTQELENLPEGLPRNAAFKDQDGRLWFGGAQGLWVGTLGNDLRLEARPVWTSTAAGKIYAIVGSAAGASIELYLLSEQGDFSRFDGARSRRRFKFEGGTTIDSALLYLGPDHALAVSQRFEKIIRYRDGEIYEEDVPFNKESPVSLASIPDLGVCVGGDVGGIACYQEGVWQTLGDSLAGSRVSSFLPVETGFLYGTSHGWVGGWVPGFGYCAPQLVAHAQIMGLLPLGKGILVAPRSLGFLEYLVPAASR